MTAPTVAVEWLLARAAVRATGLLHVVSRRDTGALNPLCGANPIRSAEIETHTRLDDASRLCEGCGALATSIGGTVQDGVALLLGLSAADTTVRLLEVPVAAVHARRDHARQTAGADIDALVESVLERGIVVPVIARRVGSGFELIDGARRLYAAAAAGLATIPAIVRDATDVDALLDGLVANLHRADLNPIEQAHAYERALEVLGCSKAELGRRLGVSREQVSNTIRLLGLPAEDQERIATGELTAQAGRSLLAATRPVPAKLGDVSSLLTLALEAAGLQGPKVRVTTTADRARIVLDVEPGDLARVLEQLGAQAAAA